MPEVNSQKNEKSTDIILTITQQPYIYFRISKRISQTKTSYTRPETSFRKIRKPKENRPLMLTKDKLKFWAGRRGHRHHYEVLLFLKSFSLLRKSCRKWWWAKRISLYTTYIEVCMGILIRHLEDALFITGKDV